MKNIYITILLVILLISCKQIEYVQVPVETIKTEYIQNDIVHYDSIYIYDHQIIKKDTVFQKYIEYRYKILTKDSIKIVKDTIEIPVIQEKIVEKPFIPKWCSWLSVIGIISIILLILFVLFKIKKFRI